MNEWIKVAVHPLRLPHRLPDGLAERDASCHSAEVPVPADLNILLPKHFHHDPLGRGGARVRRNPLILLPPMNDSFARHLPRVINKSSSQPQHFELQLYRE